MPIGALNHARTEEDPVSAPFLPALWLLRKQTETHRVIRTGEAPGAGRGRPRIRCPRCRWEPGKKDRWSCLCGHIWNTFDTGGVCPSCGHAWPDTQCLRCIEWSRHDDWYVGDGDPAGQA